MFALRPERPATIELEVEGAPVRVPEGSSVAVALLLAGVGRTTALSGAPRAPYCLMGVCFECLAEIDGVANQQACMVPARPGMRIRAQHGARRTGPA
jgi:D-hydroxyproline dehydrogenase subunit gamma